VATHGAGAAEGPWPPPARRLPVEERPRWPSAPRSPLSSGSRSTYVRVKPFIHADRRKVRAGQAPASPPGRAARRAAGRWQRVAGPAVPSAARGAADGRPAARQVLVLSPAFLKYVHDSWTQRRGRYPSTGFTALLFALHACQRVSAAGGTGHGGHSATAPRAPAARAPVGDGSGWPLCRSPSLASEQMPKGTGTTTGRKTAGPEPFAGRGSTTLTLNSASSRNWQLKAGFCSTDDAFPRN